MFDKAPPGIGNVLDGVFGLPGITILALLAGIWMGLAIAWIGPSHARFAEAATPASGWVKSDAATFGVADLQSPKPAPRSSYAYCR
jgi:PPE-repeat protein